MKVGVKSFITTSVQSQSVLRSTKHGLRGVVDVQGPIYYIVHRVFHMVVCGDLIPASHAATPAPYNVSHRGDPGVNI